MAVKKEVKVIGLYTLRTLLTLLGIWILKLIVVSLPFFKEHHCSIHSVNPLERLNREIRRRTRVVGVFPDRESVFRLVGTLLMDMDENWRGSRRYMAEDGIQKLLKPEFEEPSGKDFNLVNELLELEAQNSIYTT